MEKSDKKVQLTSTIAAEVLASFPPKENPFLHDFAHMGSTLGRNVSVMYINFPEDPMEYLIVINTKTGERIRVSFSS